MGQLYVYSSLLFLKSYLFLFYVYTFLLTFISVPCVQYPKMPEEGTGFPGIGVTGGCEPTHGYWEPILGSLQEWQMLLTAQPSL